MRRGQNHPLFLGFVLGQPLSFDQAADLVRRLARAGNGDSDPTAPVTVESAVDDYRKDLCARGSDAANADRLQKHLSAALRARPVAALTVRELRHWRDGLLDSGLSAGSVSRICSALKATLNHATCLDERIERRPWNDGLARLPGAWKPVDRTLPDDAVRAIIDAAYAHSADFGLLVNVLATTGARLSQVQRIAVRDLQADRENPRVLLPNSKKGRRREAGHTPVPIPVGLAAELSAAARGRDPGAPLVTSAGALWITYRVMDLFEEVAKAAGIKATSYSLRHSAIVRMLLRNAPVTLVAKLHDTSVKMVEKTYGRYIAEYGDAAVRAGLLDYTPAPSGDKVVVAIRR
jgi:integrase